MIPGRLVLTALTVLSMLVAGEAFAQLDQTIEFDFETPVSSDVWSQDTRSLYLYTPVSGGGFVEDTYLGPVVSDLLRLAAIDVFDFATAYSISFDVVTDEIFFPSLSTPRILTLTSHGLTLFQGELDLDDLVATNDPFGIGSYVFRVGAFISPGPVPLDPGDLFSCCGDVVIEWSLSGPDAWGIDNLVISAVPEPDRVLLLVAGLIGLVGMHASRTTRLAA